MAQANQGESPADLASQSGKRKRGRPRKEETPGSTSAKRNRRAPLDGAQSSDSFIGQMVSGVLDGRFDAGYMLTVQVGGRGNILRGLVFEPGLSVPISSANDVAPSVRMFERSHVPIPGVTAPRKGEAKPIIEDLNVGPTSVDRVNDVGERHLGSATIDRVNAFKSTAGVVQGNVGGNLNLESKGVDHVNDVRSAAGVGQRSSIPTGDDPVNVSNSSVTIGQTLESKNADQVNVQKSTISVDQNILDGGRNLESISVDLDNDRNSTVRVDPKTRDEVQNLESKVVDQANDQKSTTGVDPKTINGGQNLESACVDQVNGLKSTVEVPQKTVDGDQKLDLKGVDLVNNLKSSSVDQVNDLQSADGGRNLGSSGLDQVNLPNIESARVDQVNDLKSMIRDDEMIIDGGLKSLETAPVDRVNPGEPANLGFDMNSKAGHESNTNCGERDDAIPISEDGKDAIPKSADEVGRSS